MSFRNTIAVRVRDWTSAVVIVLVVGGMALAQTEPGQSSTDTTQSSTPPAGAFGQEATTPQVAQFPPLSGLDEPSLEPNVSGRSFFAPSFQVHQLADTNPGNAQKTGASSFSGDTHVMGNFALRRYWRRYQTSLDYTGGGVFYEGPSRVPNAQLHALNFDQAVLWRTGALHIRDAASYLPEGIFGGRFGGVGGMGGGLPGGTAGGLGGFGGGAGTSFFGTGQFGALGVAPRITNRAIIDVENSLSPRSAVTFAGGYGLSHFTGANTGLIDSRQVSAQAGYDYMLSRRNSIAVTYGFQQFTFPQGGGGRFNSHSVHLMFGRQISGRMSLKLAAGPQIVRLNSPAVGSRVRVSGSGMASLRYAFPKTSLSLVYQRVENPGSGFFAGAISDAVHGSLARPLSRRWNLMTDLGYSHHKREQISTVGLNARSYDYAYAGSRLSYLFSRTWSGFMTYQFNSFRSNGVCTTNTPCDALSDRHLFGVGISWHPQPIRID